MGKPPQKPAYPSSGAGKLGLLTPWPHPPEAALPELDAEMLTRIAPRSDDTIASDGPGGVIRLQIDQLSKKQPLSIQAEHRSERVVAEKGRL